MHLSKPWRNSSRVNLSGEFVYILFRIYHLWLFGQDPPSMTDTVYTLTVTITLLQKSNFNSYLDWIRCLQHCRSQTQLLMTWPTIKIQTAPTFQSLQLRRNIYVQICRGASFTFLRLWRMRMSQSRYRRQREYCIWYTLVYPRIQGEKCIFICDGRH